jgi:hypothetical protein
MKQRWIFRPNLDDCRLEDRLPLAIANLGVVVLTTSGLALVTPFPGASNSASGSLGSGGPGGSSTAASVSGAAFPTGIYITGNRGISTFAPGNFTGNPNVGGATSSASGGVTVTINVGSGANDSGAPAPAAPVSLATVANDALNPLPTIGTTSTGSGSPAPINGSTYRDNAPVPPPAPLGVVIPGPPTAPSTTVSANNPFAPSPLTSSSSVLNPVRNLVTSPAGTGSLLGPTMIPLPGSGN